MAVHNDVLPPYRFIDADTHYYEPRDAWTRHIEPRHRDKAVHVRLDDRGRERIWVGNRPHTFLPHWNFDSVPRPGALRALLQNMSSRRQLESAEVETFPEPPFVDRQARLLKMDEQGVEAAVVLPTVGVTVEHFMADDVEATYANLRAFNRWLEEDWGFAHEGRIFAVPLLSLLDVEQAVAELDWVLERGARIVHLRPGPAFGRSPADPLFDPFWARVQEAGAAVAFHISESSYNELYSGTWGEEPNPESHRQSAFQWTSFYGDRPIMDTISALILHNLFGRFPGVRVLSIENGSLWVAYLIKVMDKMRGMGRNGPWLGGPLTERPSEIFKRHVLVSPYHEEDITALVGAIGASQVLFGSDYPHAEGVAEPADFLAGLDQLTPTEVRLIMRDNASSLLFTPVAA